MASFRLKFQIPDLILIKEHECSSTLLQNFTIKSTIKQNARSFWWRGSKEPIKIEHDTGSCRKPMPSRIEPCTGSRSKCIEEEIVDKKPLLKRLFSFQKKPAIKKENPSNCKEVKEPEQQKLSMLEQIFGPDPKRSWPDPCTCRVAYRQRKKSGEQDPRLCDQRYRITDGDVLLYTEISKRHGHSCVEPQPKPPPSFKVPKAVLCRMMVEAAEKMALSTSTAYRTDANCKESPMVPLPFRIPYEEMRPLDRRRKFFSCKEGIQSEDVANPFNKQTYLYRLLPKSFQVDSDDNCTEKSVKAVSNTGKEDALEETVQKRSRIEQLKILIEKKQLHECISSTS